MSTELCSICLDTMNKELFFCTVCRNRFHCKCIIKMIKFNKRTKQCNLCPLCRTAIDNIRKPIHDENTPLIERNTRCNHFICKLILCGCGCIFR